MNKKTYSFTPSVGGCVGVNYLQIGNNSSCELFGSVITTKTLGSDLLLQKWLDHHVYECVCVIVSLWTYLAGFNGTMDGIRNTISILVQVQMT